MKYLVIFFMCLSIACQSPVPPPSPPPGDSDTQPPLIEFVVAPEAPLKKKKVRTPWHQRIFMLQAQSGKGYASGFAYDKDHFITAAHFCKPMGDSKIEIHYINKKDKRKSLRGATIDKYDSKSDVCVVKKKNHGLPTIPLVVKYKNVKLMDPVLTGGAPLGFFPYLKKGYVLDPKSKRFSDHLLVTSSVYFGISGGPVVNQRGRVIGMASGMYRKGSLTYNDVLMAVPSPVIKKFLVKNYGKQFLRR